MAAQRVGHHQAKCANGGRDETQRRRPARAVFVTSHGRQEQQKERQREPHAGDPQLPQTRIEENLTQLVEPVDAVREPERLANRGDDDEDRRDDDGHRDRARERIFRRAPGVVLHERCGGPANQQGEEQAACEHDGRDQADPAEDTIEVVGQESRLAGETARDERIAFGHGTVRIENDEREEAAPDVRVYGRDVLERQRVDAWPEIGRNRYRRIAIVLRVEDRLADVDRLALRIEYLQRGQRSLERLAVPRLDELRWLLELLVL